MYLNMAIEKMSFVNIVGGVKSFDSVAKCCIAGNNFQPINASEGSAQMIPFSEINPYQETLRLLTEFTLRLGVKPDFNEFYSLDESSEQINERVKNYSDKYTQNLEEITGLEKFIAEDKQIIIQLEHLKGVNVNIHDFFELEFIKFRFGRLPRVSYEKLMAYSNNDEYIFKATSVENEYAWGMLFIPCLHRRKTEALFNSLSFERVRLSDRINGTVSESIDELMMEIQKTSDKLKNIYKEHQEFLVQAKENILMYYSKIRCLHDTFELRRFSGHTGESFLLSGWVPTADIPDFTLRINDLNGVSVVVEAADATPYSPPTKLKNRAVFKPFEDFVKLYGLPDYNEFDPSPVFAISYMIIFGLMFGDVGQGAMMIIFGLLYYLLTKKTFGKIVAMLGVSASIFGFVYGSIFGKEHIIKGFVSPFEKINFMLISSVCIGAVFITVAIIINIVNGVRQKNFEKMLFSPNGAAGFIFYWAVIIGVVMIFGFGKNVFSIWYILAFIAIPIIMFFLKEPLSHLLKTKRKWRPETSNGDFVIESSVEVFDIMLGFITNTISFIRIGAFALSHAGMMLVVYILSDMAGHASIPVMIIGNIFVTAFEGFIVGIQVLRLQFYEMFSRYYDGQGVEFNPATIKYNIEDE